MKKVAVIGAGVAGLACAYELQKNGFEVHVLEKETSIGGRTKTVNKDGIPLDLGAVCFMRNERNLFAYLNELRGMNSFLPLPQKKIGFFFHGKIDYIDYAKPLRSCFSIYSSPLAIGKTIWSAIKIKWATNCKAESYFNLSKADRHVAQLNAQNFLYEKFSSDFSDHFINPVFCGLCFQTLSETSAALFLNVFIPVFISCKEADRFDSFRFTWGFQSFSELLAKNLSCRTNYSIDQVVAGAGPIRVMGRGKEEEFDRVVFACPAPAALAMYKNPTPVQQELLGKTLYGSTITLYFSIPPDLDTWDAPIFCSDTQSKVIAHISTSGRVDKTPRLIINGHGVFSVCLQDKYAKAMFQSSDKELFSKAKEELGNIFQIPGRRLEEIKNIQLQRWEYAIPKFSPATVALVRSFMDHPEGQGAQNVFFCGDYLNAPFVEGAIRSGKEAAKRIIISLR